MVREKLTFARKSFGFRLKVDLVKKLKILAIHKNSAVNVLIEEGIEMLLKKYGNKNRG
jgi:predicted transcriptional regulator